MPSLRPWKVISYFHSTVQVDYTGQHGPRSHRRASTPVDVSMGFPIQSQYGRYTFSVPTLHRTVNSEGSWMAAPETLNSSRTVTHRGVFVVRLDCTKKHSTVSMTTARAVRRQQYSQQVRLPLALRRHTLDVWLRRRRCSEIHNHSGAAVAPSNRGLPFASTPSTPRKRDFH